MNKSALASYRRLGVFVNAAEKYGTSAGNLDYLCKKAAVSFVKHLSGHSRWKAVWFLLKDAVQYTWIEWTVACRFFWWE